MGHGDEGDAAVFVWLPEFSVDEGIVEAGPGGVGFISGEIDFRWAGPVDGTQAHRTGLAGGIEITTLKLKGSEAGAGITDGVHFGMRRRVVNRSNRINAASNNFTVFNDDGSERSAVSGFYIVNGKVNGDGEKIEG